jgi:23S rRNA (guanosine2251-2'-O)-methyltransferase
MGRSEKRKNKLSSSHNKSWIWGRHAVLEVLEAGRWPIQELVLSSSLTPDAIEKAHALAEKLQLSVQVEEPNRLKELSRASEHQGYIAKMKPYIYESIEVLLEGLRDGNDGIVVAILDRIQDPHNFGAIVRTAEVLGIDAVIIGSESQVDVTPAVARSSAGAVNHISLIKVDNLAATVSRLQTSNVRILAATEKGLPFTEEDIASPNSSQSIALILGNEGDGIASELLEACDTQIRIPQRGKIESLNVAAAAAILFHELTRNR